MTVDTMILGLYQVNCYIVSQDGECVIIDPGYEPDRIADYVTEKGLTPRAILLTHGHFDHVGGVKELQKKYGIPAYLHDEDTRLPFYLTRPMGPTEPIEDGDTLELAGLSFSVLHTPGHSKGSVCYLCRGAMFSGDTLFQGSCGRTDLHGGSSGEIQKSLARLVKLEGNYTVCPGHGSSTTLQLEREHNPYL